MTYIAIKVPVVESERGWGRKIDDWMVCLTIEDAQAFKKEFNSENISSTTPDWYMQAEGEVKSKEDNLDKLKVDLKNAIEDSFFDGVFDKCDGWCNVADVLIKHGLINLSED